METRPIATAPVNPAAVKTVKLYVIGFVLSLILTLLAFALVMFPMLSTTLTFLGLGILAVAQLIVQVIYFLRLNVHSTQDRWNLMAFLFTILVVAILVIGSLWIMYNLNYNMM